MERDDHAACCLGYAGDHTHLLVIGGRRGNKTLKDLWLFDYSLKKWKEVRLIQPSCKQQIHVAVRVSHMHALSTLKSRYVCLAHVLLTAAYRSCLWSIIACIVTSCHRQHVQASAVWPHGCSFELNIKSKSRPGLLQARFHRYDDENVNVVIDIEDMSDGS